MLNEKLASEAMQTERNFCDWTSGAGRDPAESQSA